MRKFSTCVKSCPSFVIDQDEIHICWRILQCNGHHHRFEKLALPRTSRSHDHGMGTIIDKVNRYWPIARFTYKHAQTCLILLVPTCRDCLRLHCGRQKVFGEVDTFGNQPRFVIWINPLLQRASKLKSGCLRHSVNPIFIGRNRVGANRWKIIE